MAEAFITFGITHGDILDFIKVCHFCFTVAYVKGRNKGSTEGPFLIILKIAKAVMAATKILLGHFTQFEGFLRQKEDFKLCSIL